MNVLVAPEGLRSDRRVPIPLFSRLFTEAARRIDAIRQKCPEDFDRLAQRLARRIEAAAQA